MIVGDSGRPENIYCNSWRPKRDQFAHELLLTDYLVCYPNADVLRGWSVNRRLRPDAEMSLDGYFYNVELDTGEQSYAQVRRRQRRYAGSQDFLLYVTQSSRRLEGLRKNADPLVRSIALFTTLADAQHDPAGDIYTDFFGERTSIVDSASRSSTPVEKPVEEPVENPDQSFNT